MARSKEQTLRALAAHLGLIVRGPLHGPFTLHERYPPKRLLGCYRSIATLERGIERQMASPEGVIP
jgi:hypothetical protein